MKALRLVVALSLLAASLLGGGSMTFRLEYQIRGEAITRMMLFFPIRVFYEASAAVDLRATRQVDGSTCFAYAGIPRPAYVLRTLGFSGKTLALLTVGGSEEGLEPFRDELLSRWRDQAPEFVERIRSLKKFPHRLLETGPLPFELERDSSGLYKNVTVCLEPRYRHFPAKTGIYFNVFPMLADLLNLLNHRFLPNGWENGLFAAWPAAWGGDEIDFTNDLNREAGLLEKAVKSLVTVKQKFPFRLRFRVVSSGPDAIEICGEGFPDVPIWKGFMIREVFRRVRLRPVDRMLLRDEMWVGIRNSKGQGGFGWVQLKMIDSKEENQ
jgi:hypothetical protein